MAEPVATADRRNESTKVAFAHVLRGWAALTVAVSHLAVGYWYMPQAVSGLTHLAAPDPMPPMPELSRGLVAVMSASGEPPRFSYGSFGVGLFFLISGFVIPFSFRKQSRLGFIAGRVVRLWPTYAAGLSVTLITLAVSGYLTDRLFPYETAHVLKHYVLGLRDLLWMPSIDGVVWTLEIEVKFYLLCALLSTQLAAGRRWTIYVVPAALAGLVYALGLRHDQWLATAPTAYRLGWVGAVDSQMMVFMFVGVAFNFLHRGLIGRLEGGVVAAALFALSVSIGFVGFARAGAATTGFSHGAALLVFTTAYMLRDRIRGGGIAGWLADISYPLYAVHAVAGYTIMTLLITRGCSGGAALGIALIATVAAAWLIHVVVEKPTHRLASRLAHRLSPKPSVPAATTRETERLAVAA